MKPLIYYGYEIAINPYFSHKLRNKYIITNTIDSDDSVEFAPTIDEAKELINEKLNNYGS